MVYEFNHQSKDFSVGSEIYAAICGVHEYDHSYSPLFFSLL